MRQGTRSLRLSKFVTTQAQLEELVAELAGSSMLAIDTEFMREKTYYAKLCLLQLNNGTVSALVDPLAVHDLSPLVPILTDENCVKIFHAGTQALAVPGDFTADGARTVLRAAALTYVAAALTSVMQLLYFLGMVRGD